MRDANQGDEARPKRGWPLIVAGLLAVVVAAFGSIRAADGSSSADGGGSANEASAATADTGAPAPEGDEPVAGGADEPDESDGDETEGNSYKGSLEPVRMKPAKVKEPIGLDDEAEFPIGLEARVAKVEAVQGKARGPGEIDGPALRVTISAMNRSATSIPLDNTMFVVSYGKNETPGILLSGPGAKPFPGSVGAGEAVTGTSVFNIPPENRNQIQVSLTYSATEPTAVFEGPVQ